MNLQKENGFLRQQFDVASSLMELEYQHAENMEQDFKESLENYSESTFSRQRIIIWASAIVLIIFSAVMKDYIDLVNVFAYFVPMCTAICTIIFAVALGSHNRKCLTYFKSIQSNVDIVTEYKECIGRKKEELVRLYGGFSKSAETGFNCRLEPEENTRAMLRELKNEQVGLKTYSQKLMKKQLTVVFYIALVAWGIYCALMVPQLLASINLDKFSSYGFIKTYAGINILNKLLAIIGGIFMVWIIKVYMRANNGTIDYKAPILLLSEGVGILLTNIVLWILGGILTVIIHGILPILGVIIVILIIFGFIF